MSHSKKKRPNERIRDAGATNLRLEPFLEDGAEQFLTTNHGVRINDDQNSLKAGNRGATLLEDFILRGKITHFDHERIPERIVHARGSAAHGYRTLRRSLSIGRWCPCTITNETDTCGR